MNDPRNIENGTEIPSENYCDQPYIVQTLDGAWLCVLTTGRGLEGDRGQHVVSTRSMDHGSTWSPLVDIEPADGPESSWGMPLIVPSGRIYAIYNHNSDRLEEVISDSGPIRRVDTLGYFQFKYSDDHGRSWSEFRYEIPVRKTRIDRDNPYGGAIRFFWGVGKPMIHAGKVYLGFAKVGRFGHGFMAESEGWFLCSENILSEDDPAKITWQLLPGGDVGLRAPQGPVADEHNLVSLSDGSLYCTYRTVEGHNCHAYSRDGGHSWDGPQYATYSPGGQPIKHPRAANFVRKFSNGKYLLWYHNNGMKWYNKGPALGSRNIAWLAGGIEKEGYIYWSQPEIVLYDPNQIRGASYPDFIEEDNRLFISTTQKTVARIYEIDPALLDGLWNQGNSLTENGLVLDLASDEIQPGQALTLPDLADLSEEGGFSLEFIVQFDSLDAGQILFDSRDDAGKGILLSTTNRGTLAIHLSDGRMGAFWDTDQGALRSKMPQHVVIVVDGGPKVISFVVDGTLCDGGRMRPYGWGRFSSTLRDVNGANPARLAPALDGSVSRLRLYDRALRNAEAISNYRASGY